MPQPQRSIAPGYANYTGPRLFGAPVGDLSAFPDWNAWASSTYLATPTGLKIHFSKLADDFDLQNFLNDVLTHSLTGVIHPKNLSLLSEGKKLTKEWISSGPYRIQKWNPKEIWAK